MDTASPALTRPPDGTKPETGELRLHPSPNRPGDWVYRVLPEGTLKEVELSREEWHDGSSPRMGSPDCWVGRSFWRTMAVALSPLTGTDTAD